MTERKENNEKIIKKELLKFIEKHGKLPEDFRFDADIFDLQKALKVLLTKCMTKN